MSRLFRLFGLLILIGSIGGAWVMMEWKSVMDTPVQVVEEGVIYKIRPGMGFSLVINELAEQGVVSRPKYLIWTASWQGLASRIKAGEYEIRPGTLPMDLVRQFVEGRVIEYRLTLVEGWSFRQMIKVVRGHPDLVHTLEEGLSNAVLMRRIGHPGRHPEGRFLPETYRFPGDTTDVEFLQRAWREMERFLAAQWEERDAGLPLKSSEEALILASIIEKETGRADERARIAGVFIRRLRKNMRLQTDPTVIYGMGEAYDGNIRRRDLKRDTPYNTYVHKGLPPTPIAMPGKGAIMAALHPGEGDELYFVAKGDGGHYFSATLDEHHRAVRRYQLKK